MNNYIDLSSYPMNINLDSVYNNKNNAVVDVYYCVSAHAEPTLCDDKQYTSLKHGMRTPTLTDVKLYYRKVHTYNTFSVLEEESRIDELEYLFMTLNQPDVDHPLCTPEKQAELEQLCCHTTMAVGDVCCITQGESSYWYCVKEQRFELIDTLSTPSNA